MKIIILLILSIISGVLYRMGGKGKPYNTKYRDLGCPLIAIITLWFLVGFQLSYWWVYLLIFGLMFGALTTYWDFLFGFDNYWFHGFMVGLSIFPLFWIGIHWWAILIYSISLAVSMGIWSKLISWDVAEEFGRGFFITLLLSTLFLLLTASA
jgi:hypothetical protein